MADDTIDLELSITGRSTAMMTPVSPSRNAVVAPSKIKFQNELLGNLPLSVWRIWESQLELVQLEAGQQLHEPEGPILYAYFPVTAVVAKIYFLSSGASAESALIGREGMVGFPLVLGGESTPSLAVVLIAGDAWRVKAEFVRHEGRSGLHAMHPMLRFMQAMMTQMTQTGVCNRYHSIEQQLSRWLLLVVDRLPHGEFAMTQELMAVMLGVRRETVTAAAGHLQSAGLIRYARGRVSVLNRTGLERHACECYQVVRREYARLLPDRRAA